MWLAAAGSGWQLSLTVEDLGSGKQEVLRPHLVVGADGLHSTVRSTLQQWAKEDAGAGQGQQGPGAGVTASDRFGITAVDAPSADLK